MPNTQEALNELIQKIDEKVNRNPMPFVLFLHFSGRSPKESFRDVFQLFHDMIHYYISPGVNEYPDDPESINYVHYNCEQLFVQDTDNPFFADRPFANKLVNLANAFRQGAQQRRLYLFEGKPGSGKSTFLNNLLHKFEEFTRLPAGATYETVWRLDVEQLGGNPDDKVMPLTEGNLAKESRNKHQSGKTDIKRLLRLGKYIDVPCPSHDHPILQIPKTHRHDFLAQLIEDEDFKKQLFSRHEYEWIFEESPCAICTSIYQTLLDRLDSPTEIFDMLYARRFFYNRMLGEGISVYNPGDEVFKAPIANPELQSHLNHLFKDSNLVEYIYSRLAKTNNGVFAIMDIKGHNKERLMNLHGIISDAIHKVGHIEEHIKSFFIGLMNPEDEKVINKISSFDDRATRIKFHYILDYKTEMAIYKHLHGANLKRCFLPRVLDSFAKTIVSTRLNPSSQNLEEWISNPETYKNLCDEKLLLLKMDLYVGHIPSWLEEDDRKNFTKELRRKVISESENEGNAGFSGRQSIRLFNEFFSKYAETDIPVTMNIVLDFFKQLQEPLLKQIPKGFLEAVVKRYNYDTLQEVKESLYHYNEEKISRDIQNYLFAINYDYDTTEVCSFTGDTLEINEAFFKAFELKLLGKNASETERNIFRTDTQKHYVSTALAKEMNIDGKKITETSSFTNLHAAYAHNLKKTALEPFKDNDNFRQAIKDYGSDKFKTHDRIIRQDVSFLITNLVKKFNYNEAGAKLACVYVIDKNLTGELA